MLLKGNCFSKLQSYRVFGKSAEQIILTRTRHEFREI